MRLIDADALIEDVKTLWDYETVDGITSSTVLKQIVTDIQNAPTALAPRWVRCEDELPKRGRLVLAYRGPIAMISAMYTDGCGWRDADLFPMQGVTHWMPLPEPPKEDV